MAQFDPSKPETLLEKKVATADLRCKVCVQAFSKRAAVETAIQKRLIAQHRHQLSKNLHRKEAKLAATESLIGDR